MENKKVIIDASNNKVIERPMNDEELAADEKFRNEMAALALEKQKIEDEKAAARQTILDKLGLTADEAKLLLQ